jgi:hypothetical protein
LKTVVQSIAWPEVRRTFRSFALKGTLAERVVRALTTSIIVVGLWLRARGYLYSTLSLWLDEATWAVHLMTWSLMQYDIRPIGFMAVSRALARAMGPSERVLRALPWGAGVATTLMAPALGRHLFRASGARLLFVAVLALHPGAIDLSKEFKQYSVALAFHAALLLTTLRYWDSGKARDLAAALGLAFAAIFFAQDAVFAYPSIFVVLAISAVRSRRSRHVAAVLAGGALTFGVVLCMYLFIWSKMGSAESGEKYWGKKYDVFYVQDKHGAHKNDSTSKTEWTVEHYEQIAVMPGARSELWISGKAFSQKRLEELPPIDVAVWLLLHVAGVAAIVRRRRGREALLLLTPLATLVAFNVLGYWPLGSFRTNLFALVYVAAIAALAVDRQAKQVRLWDAVPALVLVVAPMLLFERTWHARKQWYSVSVDYPAALSKLLFLQGSGYSGPREPVYGDTWACAGWDYYVNYHPTFSRTTGASLRNRFHIACKRRPTDLLMAARRDLQSLPRVWLLAIKGATVKAFERSWPHDLEREMHVWSGRNKEHLVIAVTGKPAAPPPEPQTLLPEGEPEPPEEFGP